jgi:hypothetical protein
MMEAADTGAGVSYTSVGDGDAANGAAADLHGSD